jgi:RHS repeat-associated protein
MTWSHTFDFRTALWDWIIGECNITQGGGERIDGFGIRANWASGGGCDQLIRLSYNFPSQVTFTKVIIKLTETPTTNEYIFALGGSGPHPLMYLSPVADDSTWITWNGIDTSSSIGMQLEFPARGNIDAVMPHSMAIYAVVLEGEGLNPFTTINHPEPAHDGTEPACPCNHAVSNQAVTPNPISLRDGEKTEKVTDIGVVTASGRLEFTRVYRQSKLGAGLGWAGGTETVDVLGAGWLHNHAAWIDTRVTNKLLVWLEGGTQVHFTRVGSTSTYQGDPGSTATLDAGGSGDSTYILTAQDGTQYHFNAQRCIYQRRWVSGETWTYSYYAAPHFAAGRLWEVSDGQGRKLQFSYINNNDQFNDKQLWRVGDQTAGGLEGSSPTGRYVELAYVQSRLNGTLTNPARPLLSTVRDVRGHTWTYRWYGQQSGESAANQANYLLSYTSPAVDTNGDGTTDGSLIVKELTYTLSGSALTALQQRQGKSGSDPFLLTTDYAFQPGGQNITTETTATKVKTHYFAGGVYAGAAHNGMNNLEVQGLNSGYRPASQQDANGNITSLAWSSDAKTLNSVTDALGQITTFDYDSVDRLVRSKDAEERSTFYLYNPGQRQPVLMIQSDSSNERTIFGAMEADTGWTATGSATTLWRQTQVYRGDHAWYVNAQSGTGIVSRTFQLAATKTYTVEAWVYPVTGLVKMQVTGTGISGFEAQTGGITGQWQRLQATYTVGSSSVDNGKLAFIATGGAVECYVDAVSLVAHDGTRMDLNGEMEQDTGWSATGTPTPTHERRPRVDHGVGYRYVNATAAGGGIQSVTFDVTANQSYLLVARVYPITGRVKLRLDDNSMSTLSSDAGGDLNTWQTLHVAFTAVSASAGRRLQFLAENGAATFYIDSVHLVEIEAFRSCQHVVYDNRGRPLYEASLGMNTDKALQAVSRSYYLEGSGSGLLQEVRQVDMGGTNDVITRYFYDSAGRVITTRNSSNFGPCCETRTEYDAAGNVTQTIDVQDISAPTDPVKNPVTTYEYDSLGRRVQVTVHAGTTWEKRSLTLYDALGRVRRTIANYVPPQQGSSAPGDWVWRAGGAGAGAEEQVWAWRYSENNNTRILHGTLNDENLINDMGYNGRGLLRWQRDVQGQVTLYGYDDADRPVKTIQQAASPNYNNDYTGANPDPDLSDYPASSAADQDISTTQTYDAAGNVVRTTDARGSVTLTAYDALNRPTKVIRAASTPAYNVAQDPDLSAYVYSFEPGQDHVSETYYDTMGRVAGTRQLLENRAGNDADDQVWDETRYLYDTQGRPRLVIAHYRPQGNPAAWVFEGGVWKQSAGGTAIEQRSDPVNRPDNYDQNLMTTTEYDEQGRVLQTRDPVGLLTRYVYDGLGRVTRTVQNYVPVGSPVVEPAEWVFDYTDRRWELPNGTPVHGPNHDQNAVSETVYDDSGRVSATRNTEGVTDQTVYDERGRQKISIQNYVNPLISVTPPPPTYELGDPVGWQWQNGQWLTGGPTPVAITRNTTYNQGGLNLTVNDVNVISQPTYDNESRVLETRDVLGNLTRYVYDNLGRTIRVIRNYVAQGNPADWVFEGGVWKQAAGGTAIEHRSDPLNRPDNHDQNLVTETTYDTLGRVVSSRDAAGSLSQQVYDAAGRRRLSITNYVPQGSSQPADWVFEGGVWKQSAGGSAIEQRSQPAGANFDQNLITQMTYDKAGLVLSARNARGTLTAFTYDTAGQRQRVTAASGTPLATVTYTGYNKAGQTLRTIQNWIDSGTSPDAWVDGTWTFEPADNGPNDDANHLWTLLYDRAGRRRSVIQPGGFTSQTAYWPDGQISRLTDPLNIATVFRYDGLRRRSVIVQSYVAQGSSDPATWAWNATSNRWERSSSDPTPIALGPNNDENIIVRLTYDPMGRVSAQRTPRGQLNTFQYDRLGRRWHRRFQRTATTFYDWRTSYTDSFTAGQQARLERQTVRVPNGYDVVLDLDRLGRRRRQDAGNPAETPTLTWAYNLAGRRVNMLEHNGTSLVRRTLYTHDALQRPTALAYDNDGNGTVDETVTYDYDRDGQRTKLTLPGGLSVTYTYDAKGRLTTLTDWDSQTTTFGYNNADRLTATQRHNRLTTQYRHDAAGRLTRLRQQRLDQTLAWLDYTVDARGHRTHAREIVLQPGAGTDTKTYLFDDPAITVTGTWSAAAPFKVTTETFAALKLAVFGRELTFTWGTGPDHGRFDVYINGTLWQSFDAFAAVSGEQSATVTLTEGGWHVAEIRNRHDKTFLATGYRLRFKSLVAVGPDYVQNDIAYTYDKVARLRTAVYTGGPTYSYGYDVAGNLTNNNGTTYSYNLGNQITNSGFTYDSGGRLTADGSTTYTYDRAQRLKSIGTSVTGIRYDGDDNRVSQVSGGVTTRFLLDPAGGLTQVLAQTVGTATTRYVHAPQGLHALETPAGAWSYALADGLGSIRQEVNAAGSVLAARTFAPYGTTASSAGTFGSRYSFAGEMLDGAISYNRARYYHTGIASWLSLDPFEGTADAPLSLSGYGYGHGNPVNNTDASGENPALAIPALAGIGVAGAMLLATMGIAVFIIGGVAWGLINGCLVKLFAPPPAPPAPPAPPPAPPAPPPAPPAPPPAPPAPPQAPPQAPPRPTVPQRSPAPQPPGGSPQPQFPDPLGIALGVGIAAAIGGTLWWWLSRQQPAPQPRPVTPVPPQPTPTGTQDPCDSIDISPGESVADIVYSPAAMGLMPDPRRLKSIQNAVTKKFVIQYARDMCRGSIFPSIQIWAGDTIDTIEQGHTRFVAYRLANVLAKFPLQTSITDILGEDLPKDLWYEWEELAWA